MVSAKVRRVSCALCEEWEIVGVEEDHDAAPHPYENATMRVRGEWWCRVCTSLARASCLAAELLVTA
jgi:hypothetical protein